MTFNFTTLMRHQADTFPLEESSRSPDPRPSRATSERAARDLLLRAVRATRRDGPPTFATFLLRRAAAELTDLADGRERTHAGRVLAATETATEPGGLVSGRPLADALLEWAGHLEARGVLATAEAATKLARSITPGDPELALHAARLTRKQGRVDEARGLYDQVAGLEGGDAPLALMAAIGRALTGPHPVRDLGAALRRAVVAGVPEAAAVAQEERARARRIAGDVTGALRDYLASAARFADPIDRGRVGHEAADMLVRIGDLDGARRALLEVERVGHPEQVERARARLRSIAHARGDELGARRHAPGAPPSLVSLSPGTGRGWGEPATASPDPGHTHRVLRRALDRIAERRAGA